MPEKNIMWKNPWTKLKNKWPNTIKKTNPHWNREMIFDFFLTQNQSLISSTSPPQTKTYLEN